MSWHLPRAPLRDRVLFLLVVGTAATGLLAEGVSVLVSAGAFYRLKATSVFAAIATIALGHLRGHHPFDSLGPGNMMTSGRAMLVGLTAALIGGPVTEGTALLAAGLGVVVTLLDGVDGWLARRSGMSSDFGARYDMEVDALLILVLAVLAWQHDKAGAWIVLAGLMRYLFVAAGWLWRWMNTPLPPSVRRKAVCVVQIAGLSAVVSPLLAAPASMVLAAATLAALSYSFLVDVLWLRRHGA